MSGWYHGKGSLDAVLHSCIDFYEKDREEYLSEVPPEYVKLIDMLTSSVLKASERLTAPEPDPVSWETVKFLAGLAELREEILAKLEIELHAAFLRATRRWRNAVSSF